MRTRVVVAALAAALAGCAGLEPGNRHLYDWGGYDERLYDSLREGSSDGAARDRLAQHIAGLEAAHASVAPGLYGELGTLYLRSGDRARALAYYRKERAAWPASGILMDALIARLGGAPLPGSGT